MDGKLDKFIIGHYRYQENLLMEKRMAGGSRGGHNVGAEVVFHGVEF